MIDDSETSDVELWKRVAERDDVDAFACLFDRHASTIYNYAFRRNGDWSAAEEIVAVTFLEAWRRRGVVALDGDSARPWLLGVATNALRNLWRTRRRYGAAVDRLAGIGSEAVLEEDELVSRITAERTQEVLAEAIRRLPKRHQDVVWLCLVEEVTYREAAEALDVPVGTIRSRLARARRRLQADPALELFRPYGHDRDDPPTRPTTTPTPRKAT